MKGLALLTYYLPRTPVALIYMLQQVEYHPRHFAYWLRRLPATTGVIRRQKLIMTTKARLLLIAALAAWILPVIVGAILLVQGSLIKGLACVAAAPLVCIGSLLVITIIAQKFIVNPLQSREIERARQKLAAMSATRIAVLGSYGKTTMKDLLQTVLGEGKKVAATPGNKNVLISHARWINDDLTGDEEVLIFEFGEARPGDIDMLASFSRPEIAVITGLAPAHMDDYGSLDAIAADFADVQKYVSPAAIYVNAESPELTARMRGFHGYSIDGVAGWKVSAVSATLEGTTFTLSKAGKSVNMQTGLIGLHQIGPLCAVADIADKLGLDKEQIQAGTAGTKPFEHRLQPYRLGGAWVVDDTYNGNIEGAKAGLKLLSELETTGRKVYVTPGLVEQGDLKQAVHEELGRVIAAAGPDRVVLMKNSTTDFIQTGLDEAGYAGELLIEGNPLDFYTNLEHFVAGGDIVLMQNDWTDNYT